MCMNTQLLLAADLKWAGATPQQVLRQLKKHCKVDAEMEQLHTKGSPGQSTGGPSGVQASHPKCGLPGCNRPVAPDYASGELCKYCSCTHMNYAIMAAMGVQPSEVCALPGCLKPVWVDDDGFAFDYCGKTHSEQARMSPD